LGIPDVDTFIWVGRLDDNKDPLCVLKALSAYTKAGHRYKMYMFYTSIELLEEIQNFISGKGLEEYIELKGNIVHSELELWYSASDFFIAASHSEGSGYALSEAMSCGCIPILTDIPAFSYMTNKGKAGLLFTPGDAEELLQRLLELRVQDRKILQSYVKEVFENRLSFMAIASRMMEIFELKK
jgi:glycosyltransferase involved in cell wall biosynthesis